MNLPFNSGFCLGIINDLIVKSGIDIAYDRKLLSSFYADNIISGIQTYPMNNELKELLLVYDNIISRGLPTFTSLYLEKEIIKLLGLSNKIREINDSGSIKFISDEDELENKIIDQLYFAHKFFDSDYRPDFIFTDNTFDSNEEKIFYRNILPQKLGNTVSQFFEPQRFFETLVPERVGADFYGQKVDFTLQTKDTKLIIEIDGEQHRNDPIQIDLDNNKRTCLRQYGWTVLAISAAEVRQGLSNQTTQQLLNFIDKDPILQNIRTNNHATTICNTLVKIPYAISRIQKAFTNCLINQKLSFEANKWKIGIIERDYPCAFLALSDWLITMDNLLKIRKNNSTLPEIELFIFSAHEQPYQNYINTKIKTKIYPLSENTNTFEFDVVFDISTEKRHGDKPSQDFLRRYIHRNGTAYIIRSSYYPFDYRKINSTRPIVYDIDENNHENLKYFLQNIFRKCEFREGQVEILKRALSLKPVIGLLPTGAGKSLTYQLASLLQPGITLVVDPLRSLMFDQADNLKDAGIDNIEFINSEQTPEEREKVKNKMAGGCYQIVFIAPERMQENDFRNRLQQATTTISFPYFVIDEAHCVSEWGHDFRTSYLNLAKSVQKFCIYQNHYKPVVIALTGTASYAVLTDVQREIGLDEEESKIYPSTFDRQELRFDIYKIASENKRRTLQGLLQDYLPQKLNCHLQYFFRCNGSKTMSGLVFVPHVNGEYGEEVKNFLTRTLGTTIRFYSGEPPRTFEPQLNFVERDKKWNEEKRRIQNEYKHNMFPLLVSTKAFGMGIDKPNIRYTIHFVIPHSLESFYQEAGRAGRDRQTSYCIIIFSDDNAENANQFLNPNLTADQIATIREPAWPDRGDIHRIMFFHRRAFEGINVEMEELVSVLNSFIYPVLNEMNEGETKRKLIPFGQGEKKSKREKAIYRLSILGLIDDYTLDYNASNFEVVILKQKEAEYLEQIKNYIARYKTLEFVNTISNSIQQHQGINFLEKCLRYLVTFVYDEIEKKRRLAISTIAQMARECCVLQSFEQRDRAIRERLLAYLEKSIFTEPLLEMSKRIQSSDWWNILSMVDDIDKARQLLGGCRRTLESFPDHPGLYFLSAFARMILPLRDFKNAKDEISSGLKFLKESIQNDDTLQQIAMELLDHYQRKIKENTNQIAEIILTEIPTRLLAKRFFQYCPANARKILLHNLVRQTKTFNYSFLKK